MLTCVKTPGTSDVSSKETANIYKQAGIGQVFVRYKFGYLDSNPMNVKEGERNKTNTLTLVNDGTMRTVMSKFS